MGPIVLLETSRVRLIEFSRYQDSTVETFIKILGLEFYPKFYPTFTRLYENFVFNIYIYLSGRSYDFPQIIYHLHFRIFIQIRKKEKKPQ